MIVKQKSISMLGITFEARFKDIVKQVVVTDKYIYVQERNDVYVNIHKRANAPFEAVNIEVDDENVIIKPASSNTFKKMMVIGADVSEETMLFYSRGIHMELDYFSNYMDDYYETYGGFENKEIPDQAHEINGVGELHIRDIHLAHITYSFE